MRHPLDDLDAFAEILALNVMDGVAVGVELKTAALDLIELLVRAWMLVAWELVHTTQGTELISSILTSACLGALGMGDEMTVVATAATRRAVVIKNFILVYVDGVGLRRLDLRS